MCKKQHGQRLGWSMAAIDSVSMSPYGALTPLDIDRSTGCCGACKNNQVDFQRKEASLSPSHQTQVLLSCRFTALFRSFSFCAKVPIVMVCHDLVPTRMNFDSHADDVHEDGEDLPFASYSEAGGSLPAASSTTSSLKRKGRPTLSVRPRKRPKAESTLRKDALIESSKDIDSLVLAWTQEDRWNTVGSIVHVLDEKQQRHSRTRSGDKGDESAGNPDEGMLQRSKKKIEG